MFTLSHKATQYLLVALKVLILVGTFYYIVYKLNTTATSIHETLQNVFHTKGLELFLYLLYYCLFVCINWLFEILKWKSLVSHIKKITFSRAAKESLAALTVSLATPNRIGEYGAKALFHPKEERKKIVVLNLIGNGFQMLITVFFGAIGLIYLILFFDITISWIWVGVLAIAAVLFGVFAYYFKEQKLLIKGFTIANLMAFYTNLSREIKTKTLVYAVIRYVTFSWMFLQLLHFFDVQFPIFEGIAAVTGMYLVASLLPSLVILDIAVKGGVAVFLFSLIGVPEIPVICTVLIMWLLQMVLPALLGSVFLFSIKKQVT